MTTIGFFLAAEEYDPTELVRIAERAQAAGFDALWISDHYHPWNDAQGESAFVWSVIGAISQVTDLRITTAVTCPTMRIHPAVIAQAAATSTVLCGEGRFGLGVGTGENLNEHILGDRWPETDVRLEMLEEAVEIMRRLWTGDLVSHHGKHYTVSNARLYSLPERPPPVLVSAFGPKAAKVAARIGDGYIGTSPSADVLQAYRDAGGGGPLQGGMKICWGPDEQECIRQAKRLWGTSALPGELAQELPNPAHFEQGAQLVRDDDVTSKYTCGPDIGRHVGALRKYLEAGYDEVYVAQIGGADQRFFDMARDELLPAAREARAAVG